MTRRITISLPDDVADDVERSAGRMSGFIADALRRKMWADGLRARWAERGYLVTDEDVERAHRRLAERPPISSEQHDRNMRWLRQFGDDEGLAEDAADVSTARDALARIDAGDTPVPLSELRDELGL